jgi:hypothetical protein
VDTLYIPHVRYLKILPSLLLAYDSPKMGCYGNHTHFKQNLAQNLGEIVSPTCGMKNSINIKRIASVKNLIKLSL